MLFKWVGPLRLLAAFLSSAFLVTLGSVGSQPASAQTDSLAHSRIRQDRVRQRCQGNKFTLYIDRVRGIGSVDLSWPASKKAQLVLHFKNFSMLERLALTTGDRTFDTCLRTLKDEKSQADCAKMPEPVFKLLQDRTNTKGGDIVVLVGSAITTATTDQKLQVSWIDAYR
ncbi:MAG: hypothetical protein KA794_13890 [Candidatus Obscuribacter sp.]|nr:hypothetical protein [Candidatus Obscuribacter sp.]